MLRRPYDSSLGVVELTGRVVASRGYSEWGSATCAGTYKTDAEPSRENALGTSGPEAVQNTGRNSFRQPLFVDIKHTRGYILWFLSGPLVG
jgi:hypothetical protein